MSIQEKFENFKSFVQKISHNAEVVEEYQNMTWLKLQGMAYVFLLPNRDKLDEIVGEMSQRLDFESVHLPKFKRYMQLFIDYLGGSERPSQALSSEDMKDSFKLSMQKYSEENPE